MKPDTRYCVDCRFCTVSHSVTATGTDQYTCTGVISLVTGRPMKKPCAEARALDCNGELFSPREVKNG